MFRSMRARFLVSKHGLPARSLHTPALRLRSMRDTHAAPDAPADPQPSRWRRALLRACLVAVCAPRAGTAWPRETLRYGGDDSFAPFESLDAAGRPQGFQIDLIHEIGRVLEIEVQITLLPWAKTEAALRAGTIDAIAMVDTAERRSWARFVRSHATPIFAVYLRRGQPDPQVLSEAAGRRVAVLAGEAMQATLHDWLAGIAATYLRVADGAQALAAVQRGDADWALLPRAYGDRALAALGAGDVVAGTQGFRLQAYALAVAPGAALWHERLQRALDELERSGRLDELRMRWLGSHRDLAEQSRLRQSLAHARVWTWGIGAAGVAAAAGLGALVWRRGQRVRAERQRRRDAESALQRAEELLARSFTRNPEPMLVVERGSGIVRDANDALLALLGVQAESFIGQPLAVAGGPVDAQTLAALAAMLDREGTLDAAALRLERADGQQRECLVSADPIRLDDSVHLFCIVRDITEQLQHDALLRDGYAVLSAKLREAQRVADAARASQQRAEEAMQDFTQAVAHGLRAPLHAVEGFVGLLRLRLREGHVQEAVAYSEHIERAAKRMSAMVAALNGLARVSREALERTPVDMTRIARDTWQQMAASAPQREVACRIDDLPPAQADLFQVAQVWQNLLDNAWKFTTEVAQPRVAIDSVRDPRGTWYRVTDNGAGFDMAHASRLFVPFQRMHGAGRFAGNGVGLSLVKRIIEHHEGDIRVRSAPGVGTVVEFTLDPPPQTPPSD